MAQCPGHYQLAVRWTRALAAAPSTELDRFRSSTLALGINGPSRAEGGTSPWDPDSLAHAMLGGNDCQVSWNRGRQWITEYAEPFLNRHAPTAGAGGVATYAEGAVRYRLGGVPLGVWLAGVGLLLWAWRSR
jgi:hypothetical protein